MLKRAMGTLVCALAVAAFASVGTQAVAADKGTEGKVVSVDAAKGTVTITSQGNEKTYTISAATTIVGPRGGIVRRRLHDPRFHEGLPITVVATGNAATELLLGVDRKAAGKSTEGAAAKTGSTSRSSGFRGDNGSAEEPADEDNEYPGKVKSVDPDKNLLVVTLLTGKDRSFMVSHDAKLMIGSRISQKGLTDPSLASGAKVTVVTDEGGKKVKEVHVGTVSARRSGPRRFGLGRPVLNNNN